MGWLKALRGKNAITLTAWLWYSPLSIIGTGFLRLEGAGASYLDWIYLGLAGHLFAGLVLFVMGKAIWRPDTRLAVATALLTIFIAGAARGLAISLIGIDQGWFGPEALTWRPLAGALVMTAWFVAGSVVIDSVRNFAETQRRLDSALSEELDLVRRGEADLIASRDETLSEISKIVDLGLTQVEGAVKSLQGQREIASSLRALVDGALRPIIERLGTLEIQDREKPETPSSRTWTITRATLRRAFTLEPFQLWPTFVISVMGSTTSKIFSFGWLFTFFDIALIAAAVFISFKIGGRLIALLVRKKVSDWLVAASTVLVWSIPALVSSQLPTLWVAQPVVDPLARLALFNNLFFSAMLMAMAAAYFQERQALLDQLSLTLERVSWQRSHLGQLELVERRRLSRLLHGQVQARIRSAAMLIERGAARPDLGYLSQLRQDIEHELFEVETEALEPFINKLIELWEGVAEISWRADRAVVKALKGDVGAEAAAIEILRETVSNAVKHSESSRVSLEASIRRARGTEAELCLTVLFDGPQVPKLMLPGFGMTLITSLTTSFEFDYADEMNVFRANLPIRL